ncbi:MAG: HEAT repeat domain-containing protein [Planctomycetota bacterium]
MGRTAGLSQRAGAKTGDGIVVAGRGVGKLLKTPSKLWPIGTRKANKKRTTASRPDTEPAGESQAESPSQLIAAQTEARTPPADSKDALAEGEEEKTKVNTLEADLAAVKAELEEARSQAALARAESATQVGALQSERESLRSDLEEARVKAEEASAKANELEADLASVKAALGEAHSHEEAARAESSSQLGALRSEKESLLLDLKNAQTEAEKSGGRADALEADLVSVRGELEEVRNQTQEAQGSSPAEVDALQSERESLLSDLRGAQARAEEAESRAADLDAESSELWESLQPALNEYEELRSALKHEPPFRRAEAEVEDPISGENGPHWEELAVEPDEEPAVAIAPEESAPQTGERGVAVPPRVTVEEAHAAVFSGAAERVRFTRALSNLESDHVTTRAAAAKAMGAIPHELSVRALIARFCHEASAEVRQECLCALTALDAAEAIPLAEGALEDEAASVRLAAVRAIYRLVGLEGANALTRVLHDKDEDVRRRAVTCLGWLGHEPLAFKLVSLLQDKSASVRLATLEALGNLKSPTVLDDVIELLDDADDSVQRAAFLALETITGKQMGERFPEDKDGRRLVIARWRAWGERSP